MVEIQVERTRDFYFFFVEQRVAASLGSLLFVCIPHTGKLRCNRNIDPSIPEFPHQDFARYRMFKYLVQRLNPFSSRRFQMQRPDENGPQELAVLVLVCAFVASAYPTSVVCPQY